ncbi:MmcQ/YjbR family DNA-binding protein [Corynebacterium suranareeae]|nr:MmcQ/YjbR family DNA-binding protein [Corynebacterium suranareeae]
MDLHHIAARHAQTLPLSTKEFPFGPEHEVYKVRGKVFLLLTILKGKPIITLKSDPEIGASLRSGFPTIEPGYHMNKVHWLSISAGERITVDLIEGLVEESYQLVVSTLPASKRP